MTRERAMMPDWCRVGVAAAVLAGAATAWSAGPPASPDSAVAPPRTPLRIEDIDASKPIPLHPTLPLFLHVQAQPPPPPPFTDLDEQDLAWTLADPQSGGDDDFRPQAPETSIELALKPKIWVHPVIPRQAYKRRIEDAVILQCLIDPSGRVQRVRVLRGIPNCTECTKNARLAAERMVYPAPPRAPHIREVWTTPFKFQFTAGRRVPSRR